MKKIALLGCTGSIGTQTLDVVRLHSDLFSVTVLACHKNIERLAQQVSAFHPHAVVITDEKKAEEFKKFHFDHLEIYTGEKALSEAVKREDVDLVLVSVVGITGLEPTLQALRAGKELALANKETLVAGGALVTALAKEKHILIRPVDSEHSAVFQSMQGQDTKHIHKLILTASGGPFFGKTKEELKHVTLADAMNHPTWHMGKKVTIDSATMFNKGLEVIEAHWLFNMPYEKISVVVQPQSLIHSMVEYDDGSIMAQLGNPDMRLPIQYALTYPERLPSPSHAYMDWSKLSSIRIGQVDTKIFRSLHLAYEAGKAGGDMTTVFNAANEEAVKAFVAGEIAFLTIFDVTEDVLNHWTVKDIHSVEDILASDHQARDMARKVIQNHSL
jgi:1-deoxy-D-xylulose-5-phosphate reductoisomerase